MREACEALVDEIIAEAVKRVEASQLVEVASSTASSVDLAVEAKKAVVKAVTGPEVKIFGFEMSVKLLQLATMIIVALFSFIMAAVHGKLRP